MKDKPNKFLFGFTQEQLDDVSELIANYPDEADVNPNTQSRSTLESSERAWARGDAS